MGVFLGNFSSLWRYVSDLKCLGFYSTCACSLTFYWTNLRLFLVPYLLFICAVTSISACQSYHSYGKKAMLINMNSFTYGRPWWYYHSNLWSWPSVKGKRRKAISRIMHLVYWWSEPIFPWGRLLFSGRSSFLKRPCLLLLFNANVCSGHSLPSGVWASMWTRSGSLSRPETDLGENERPWTNT